MKLDLNINSAMKLRKRLKALANGWWSSLYGATYVTEPDMKEALTKQQFENGTPEKTFELLDQCLQTVVRLSDAIDKNNTGRPALNKINMLNEEINLLEHIISALNEEKSRKERNPVTGAREIVQMDKISDFDFVAKLAEIKRRRTRLEDELADANSLARFEFELDDTLYNLVYGD